MAVPMPRRGISSVFGLVAKTRDNLPERSAGLVIIA